MKYLKCAVLAALPLLASTASAESRSAVLSFPAGATTIHALFTSAQDLLKREYKIEKSLIDQELQASVTYYDTVSAFRSGTAKSTLSWKVELRTESDGRITVTITHTALGYRTLESVPLFAQNMAVGAGAASSGAMLTLDGVTKPLAEWKSTP
jgi:hypothetical protein